MSRRDDSPTDFLPMESPDYPGFAGRNKTIWRTPEIHRPRNTESPDSQSAGYGKGRPAHPQGLCGGTPSRGIYTYGAGLQPASHSDFHVPLGKGLSANGHPPNPLDKEYSCFHGFLLSTGPSGFIGLSTNAVPAGSGNKGQVFTPGRFFTCRSAFMACTASFWLHFRDCSMTGTEISLHFSCASFKETSLKHFQWGISCVRSSKRETTQTVSRSLSSFNFSCPGNADDAAFSFTIVSNRSLPSRFRERGTRELPGEREHVSSTTRIYINAFLLLHAAFPKSSVFGIGLFAATPFQYPGILPR